MHLRKPINSGSHLEDCGWFLCSLSYLSISTFSALSRYSLTFRIRNKCYLKIECVCMCVEEVLRTAFNSLRSSSNRRETSQAGSGGSREVPVGKQDLGRELAKAQWVKERVASCSPDGERAL